MGKLTATHTYATLEISESAYDEIANKLRKADYNHAFNEAGEIDMHGLALVKPPPPEIAIADNFAAKAVDVISKINPADAPSDAHYKRWVKTAVREAILDAYRNWGSIAVETNGK